MAPNEHSTSHVAEEYEVLQEIAIPNNQKPQILSSEQYSLLVHPQKKRFDKKAAISKQVGDLWQQWFLVLWSSCLRWALTQQQNSNLAAVST